MGLKKRIKANEKPVIVPKPPPPLEDERNPGTQRFRPLAAFGQPLRVSPNPRYQYAPSIQGYLFVAAWRVDHTNDEIRNFLNRASHLGNVHKLYHGTRNHNIESICAQGLRPGDNGMFGPGIYMGGPEKAIGYAGVPYYVIKRNPKLEGVKYILELEAALGKVKQCGEAEYHNKEKLDAEGFNSVGGFANRTNSWSGKLRHNEYVVYSPDQVIVHRILEYHALPKAELPPPPEPVEGVCAMLVQDGGAALTAHNRAFKDIVSQKVCGKKAYTQVNVLKSVSKTSKKTIKVKLWICKDCIDRMKLRTGSKIEFLGPDLYGRDPVRIGKVVG